MIIYNGEFYNVENQILTLNNRAFRYGDGFFETIRCQSGKPLWMEKHLQRIVSSLQVLKMDLSIIHEVDLDNLIAKLLSYNEFLDSARIRITFFRRGEGYYKPQSSGCSFIIEAAPLDDKTYSINLQGKMIGIYPDMSKLPSLLSPIKSINAQLNVLAAIYASVQNLDDCLITNPDGGIAECISSNIFLVKKDTILTPSINQGCVDGIMRKIIIEIAIQEGYQVIQCPIYKDDLFEADELFSTNAIQGVQWIMGLERKRYYRKVSVHLMDMLLKKAGSPKLIQ